MIRLCFLVIAVSSAWVEELPSRYHWGPFAQYYFTDRYKDLFGELGKKGFSEQEVEEIFLDSQVRLHRSLMVKKKRESCEDNPYLDLIRQPTDSISLGWGKEFVAEYKNELEETEGLFHVDKEVIVAILRIETNFGKDKGSYRVFNVFNTKLALSDSQEVQEKAKEELVYFLVICRKNGWDPLDIWGSCAGCFGECQCMPSSYIKFGIDGNRNGRIDLFETGDAIYTIGNYLHYYGYNRLSSPQTEEALWAYNNDSQYVEAVLWYARELKKLLKKELEKLY